MALGINRTGDFRKGSPINTATHNFGNPVDLTTKNFGNPIPTDGKEQNKVTWSPDPAHFGNAITDG